LTLYQAQAHPNLPIVTLQGIGKDQSKPIFRHTICAVPT